MRTPPLNKPAGLDLFLSIPDMAGITRQTGWIMDVAAAMQRHIYQLPCPKLGSCSFHFLQKKKKIEEEEMEKNLVVKR